ncbi:hypothetical protein L345_09808, partial [Ophiophagus hannah]
MANLFVVMCRKCVYMHACTHNAMHATPPCAPHASAHVHVTPSHVPRPTHARQLLNNQLVGRRHAHMRSGSVPGNGSRASRNGSACHFWHACHRFTNTTPPAGEPKNSTSSASPVFKQAASTFKESIQRLNSGRALSVAAGLLFQQTGGESSRERNRPEDQKKPQRPAVPRSNSLHATRERRDRLWRRAAETGRREEITLNKSSDLSRPTTVTSLSGTHGGSSNPKGLCAARLWGTIRSPLGERINFLPSGASRPDIFTSELVPQPPPHGDAPKPSIHPSHPIRSHRPATAIQSPSDSLKKRFSSGGTAVVFNITMVGRLRPSPIDIYFSANPLQGMSSQIGKLDNNTACAFYIDSEV